MPDALNDRDRLLGGFVERPPLKRYAAAYAEHFAIHRDSGVVEIRMHSKGGPAVFSRGLLNAWGRVLAEAGADPDNEVLIITGTGRQWMAGIDPRSFAEPLSQWPGDLLYEQYSDGARLLESLVLGIDVPTIGVLNGPGPRQELALICDITLCADDVVIADGNFAAGSVPGDGMYLALEELLGTKRAAHLAYTGEGIDAATALRWGVVNEVLPSDQLTHRAHRLAETIMATPRTSRRLTHAVVSRPWRRRITEELRSGYARQLLASSGT
ncbi:enoyl-CoA hydratase/isomerase family protein [Streptomyces sp. NPDC058240]|uniref:enoyl-CoA hydratase/isomerase family protein n=1 Tax=Streptomyces sp. NPDC058240 TaxID=3346396 RepID=UPI0036E35685